MSSFISRSAAWFLAARTRPSVPRSMRLHSAGEKGGFRRGVVFTFLRQIVGEQLHKAHVTRAVGMAQQVGGLVERGDVFVLVHCAQRRAFFMGKGPARGRRCGKKFIVDVKFHQVARGKGAWSGAPFLPLTLMRLLRNAL